MLKVLYAGSPAPSADVLRRLLEGSKGSTRIAGGHSTKTYKVVGVLTNPPSAQGRHKTLVPTPVAQTAAEYGTPIICPKHLDAECREEVSRLGADILVCFAYGHIFGPKFLSLFPLGGMNLHPSLLPRYRGPTPVPQAILNGDKETAVTIQRISLGMDEGDILLQKRIALDGTETALTLLDRCATEGADLFIALLDSAAATGALPAGTPQTGEASYTKTITKEDGRIDWGMSAVKIDALIRAYTPAPGAWTVYKGETLRILKAHAIDLQAGSNLDDSDKEVAMTDAAHPPASPTANRAKRRYAARFAGGLFAVSPGTVIGQKKGEGIAVQTGKGTLAVTMLQRQGKKAMDDASFVNGEKAFIGSVLGECAH